MSWNIIDTGQSSAIENMALDVAFLEDLKNHHHPILHLYEWKSPSATYGYFINPDDYLNLDAVKNNALELARRPTGGGIIFHLTDFAFSALVPASHPKCSLNTLKNYAFINELVIEVIQRFLKGTAPSLMPVTPPAIDEQSKNFCMANPTKYDVMLDGRKVGGAAQRRTRHGFLHQGSICLAFPDESFLNDILLPESKVLEAMRLHSPVLLSKTSAKDIKEARRQLRCTLVDVISQL